MPIEGHAGFGTWSSESSVNHYIHQSKFDWNYGSSVLWDHIMGTNYDLRGQTQPLKNSSFEQASLVGCAIGPFVDAPSYSIENQ
jgi:hypothetical protein